MQVRAAAVQTVGVWLGEPGVLGVLAGSAPLTQHAADWAEAVGNALLDPAHAVCAHAFAAVRCAFWNKSFGWRALIIQYWARLWSLPATYSCDGATEAS